MKFNHLRCSTSGISVGFWCFLTIRPYALLVHQEFLTNQRTSPATMAMCRDNLFWSCSGPDTVAKQGRFFAEYPGNEKQGRRRRGLTDTHVCSCWLSYCPSALSEFVPNFSSWIKRQTCVRMEPSIWRKPQYGIKPKPKQTLHLNDSPHLIATAEMGPATRWARLTENANYPSLGKEPASVHM